MRARVFVPIEYFSIMLQMYYEIGDQNMPQYNIGVGFSELRESP